LLAIFKLAGNISEDDFLLSHLLLKLLRLVACFQSFDSFLVDSLLLTLKFGPIFLDSTLETGDLCSIATALISAMLALLISLLAFKLIIIGLQSLNLVIFGPRLKLGALG